MSFKSEAGSLRGSGPMSTAAAISAEFRRVVPELVRRDGRSSKDLARCVGVVPRQIDNIRQEQHLPSVPTFIALAREIPELKAEVLRWLEAERDLDPAVDRLSNDIMRLVEQFEAARGRKAFNGGGERG